MNIGPSRLLLRYEAEWRQSGQIKEGVRLVLQVTAVLSVCVRYVLIARNLTADS
jgi:hypothetical protein